MKALRFVIVGVGLVALGIVIGVALGQYKCARDREHIAQVLYHGTADEAKRAAEESVREFRCFVEALGPAVGCYMDGQTVRVENILEMADALAQSEVMTEVPKLWADGAISGSDAGVRRRCLYDLQDMCEAIRFSLGIIKNTVKYEGDPTIRAEKEALLAEFYDCCHKESPSSGASDASRGTPEPENVSPPSQDVTSVGKP